MKSNLKLFKFLLAVLAISSAGIVSAQLNFTTQNLNQYSCVGTPEISITIQVTNGTPPYQLTYSDGTNSFISTSNGNYYTINTPWFTPGTYSYNLVSISDAIGQTATINQMLSVQVAPLPNIQAVVTQTPCTVTICGSGGIAYTLSNGLTASCQPFTPTSIGTTNFVITGTGPNGCTNSAQGSFTVTSLPPSASNVPVAVIDSAYCNDGTISLSLTSPAPFSIDWSGTNNTSPFLTGLSAGNYAATVVDTAGCIFHVSYTVPEALITTCGIIHGKLLYDMDASCSETPGDIGAGQKWMVANPGNHLANVDFQGNYKFRLDPGTYTLQEGTPYSYSNAAPHCNLTQTVTVAAGDVVYGIDFYDTVDNVVDLHAYGYLWEVRPGFNFFFKPFVYNSLLFHDFQNTEAWFAIPAGVTFLNWSHPHTVSNDTVYFNVGTGNTVPGMAQFHATNVQLGDVVSFCTGVDVDPLESNTTNNSSCVSTIAIGSFDPNDKTTFVNGTPTNGTIYMEDQVLDYVIRFQNTGTADAVNVSVLDTIQSELNLASFDLISTSHNCNLILLEGNVLKFDFPSIHLPDSTTDEAGSHGYIHYRIRQSPGNSIGTEIKNTAYIYFDFNEAVITNTTTDLIVDPAGLNEITNELIQLYPNPTGGKFTVSAASEIKSLTLFGLSGQVLKVDNPKEKQTEMDLSNFSKGVYLIKIETQHGVALKKVQRN